MLWKYWCGLGDFFVVLGICCWFFGKSVFDCENFVDYIVVVYCEVLDWVFFFKGCCLINVEIFGFILFGLMFGGSGVEWSELLIKIFISCWF